MIMSTNTEKSCPLVSSIDFKKHRKSIVITRTFHTFVYAKSAKMLFYYQKESQELHLSRFRVALTMRTIMGKDPWMESGVQWKKCSFSQRSFWEGKDLKPKGIRRVHEPHQ